MEPNYIERWLNQKPRKKNPYSHPWYYSPYSGKKIIGDREYFESLKEEEDSKRITKLDSFE